VVSLKFGFAMEDKIKGKEKDSMFENLASMSTKSPRWWAPLPLFSPYS